MQPNNSRAYEITFLSRDLSSLSFRCGLSTDKVYQHNIGSSLPNLFSYPFIFLQTTNLKTRITDNFSQIQFHLLSALSNLIKEALIIFQTNQSSNTELLYFTTTSNPFAEYIVTNFKLRATQ